MKRRHLLVVLPGIGGSTLAHPETGKTVWDARVPHALSMLWNGERLNLAEQPRLLPIGLTSSAQLGPDHTVIPGYETLVDRLRALPGAVLDVCREDRGRNPDANVLLFPYDFRLGVVPAAHRLADEIRARLAGLDSIAQSRRVVVIGHSMGGLVARYWMGPLGGSPFCRALITLGTPHRGAPKALDTLVNNPGIGPGFLAGRRSDLGRVLRAWHGVGDLLPRYPAIRCTKSGRTYRPHELGLPRLSDAARAWDMHQDIETSWRDVAAEKDPPQVVPRIGFSHPTLGRAEWDGKRLRVSRGHPEWLPAGEWAQDLGDSTVPAISALPLEMSNADPAGMRIAERHGPMAAADFVTAMVEGYERWAPLGDVCGDERPDALGLDLPETQLAGEPVPVSVDLPDRAAEGGRDVKDLAVWMRVTRQGDDGRRSPVGQPEQMDRTGPLSFVTELRPAEPGMYHIEVRAPSVPGAGDLTTGDWFGVLR